MWEKLCEKCGMIFTTPKTFDEHICDAPPPANDDLRDEAEQLAGHLFVNAEQVSLAASIIQPFLTQVAARATLKEHDELCRDCRNYRQNTQEKRDLMGYERCERGAELQKVVGQ